VVKSQNWVLDTIDKPITWLLISMYLRIHIYSFCLIHSRRGEYPLITGLNMKLWYKSNVLMFKDSQLTEVCSATEKEPRYSELS
jgi:hypothetical protein